MEEIIHPVRIILVLDMVGQYVRQVEVSVIFVMVVMQLALTTQVPPTEEQFVPPTL